MTDMFQSDQSIDTQFFGPSNMVDMFDSVKFKFFRKILPYSFYDFYSKKSKVGIRDYDSLNKMVMEEGFVEEFYFGDIENHIRQKVEEKNLNDITKNIDQQGCYFDKSCIIQPIFLDGGRVCNYLFIPHKIKGNLNKQKLKELKIPGNLMGQLVKNGEIEFNGKVIKIEELKEQDKPSPIIAIFDIQNIQQMEELIQNQVFQEIEKDQDRFIQCAIHICDIEVVNHPKYIEFQNKLGEECKHVFCGMDRYNKNTNINNQDQVPDHYLLTNKFNEVFPEFFEKLQNEKQMNRVLKNEKILVQEDGNKYFMARQNYQFDIVPYAKLGYTAISGGEKVTQFEEKLFEQEVQNQNFNNSQQQNNKNQLMNKDIDPEVTVLGTSCMKPTILRNVSGYLIEHENINILLDAGDGTYYQMLNHFGEQRLYDEVLEKLQIIFISHYHSDHYLGFQQVITKRNQVLKEKGIQNKPLYLLIPFVGAPWVKSLEQYFEDKLEVQVVFLQQLEQIQEMSMEQIEQKLGEIQAKKVEEQQKQQVFHDEQIIQQSEQDQDSQGEEEKDEEQSNYVHPIQRVLQDSIIGENFGNLEENLLNFKKFLFNTQLLKHMECVPVFHCQQAYGVVLHYDSVYYQKITYSGDTKPCPLFVEKSMGANLMIHEATFYDDFESIESMSHSTLTQAITAGYTSGAERLLLTHFSQRYKKIDMHAFVDGYDPHFYDYLRQNTALAFDHLHFRLSQFEQLPAITRTATYLFPEEKEKKKSSNKNK